MSDTSETIALTGPDNGRWHFTQIPDWIALCPDLKDGGFRLYCILRSLIIEKQDDHVRVLTHDQIASLMVGKNGKPSTVSTVKALLRNLEDVGLIEHPDGTRMASPTGRGNPNAKLRYRLNDWPDKQRYAGWRNAFDKLDWYTADWEQTRTDVAGPDYAAWLAGEGKASPARAANEGGEQKASPQAKENTRHGRSFSSQDSPVTSENVSPNKPLEEVPARSSSSSAEVEDITHEAAAPVVAEKKTKMETSSDIIKTRLADEQVTDTEADQIAKNINDAGDGHGGRIKSLPTWVANRDINTLRDDLMLVRGLQPPAQATYSQDPSAYYRRINKPASGPHSAATPEEIAAFGNMGDRQARAHMFGPVRTKPPHDPRYAPGTGSWVDPNAQYTTDPKVVFGTSDADEFSGDF